MRPSSPIRRSSVHQLQPLARVHAVERLVQQQHRRVVDQRGGIFTRCRMPLRVRADRAGPAAYSISTVARARAGRGVGVGAGRAAGVGEDELAPGEEVVHRLALGDDADRRGTSARCARPASPSRVTAPVDGREEAGHHVDERGLAGAVGAEQAGDAGAERQRDVVDGDDVAEPAGDVVDARGPARRSFGSGASELERRSMPVDVTRDEQVRRIVSPMRRRADRRRAM